MAPTARRRQVERLATRRVISMKYSLQLGRFTVFLFTGLFFIMEADPEMTARNGPGRSPAGKAEECVRNPGHPEFLLSLLSMKLLSKWS
jgi:hypothetical protein